MNSFKRSILLAASASVIAACGGGGSPQAPTAVAPPTTVTPPPAVASSVGGQVTAGLASCNITVRAANGASLAQGASGANGLFDIILDGELPSIVRVEADNCTYADEMTGETRSSASMSVGVATRGARDVDVQLTPLTTWLDRDTDYGSATPQSIEEAIRALSARISSGADFDLTRTAPVVSVDAASSTAAEIQRDYGLWLATLSSFGTVEEGITALNRSLAKSSDGAYTLADADLLFDAASRFEMSGRNLSGKAATTVIAKATAETTQSVAAAPTSAPTFSLEGKRLSAKVGDAFSIQLSELFSDPDSDVLRYHVAGLQNGLMRQRDAIEGVPTKAGTFLALVTAYDAQGNSAVVILVVDVAEADVVPDNQAPIAKFAFTADGDTAPVTVGFDAAESSDPDGNIVSWSWDLGNGKSNTGRAINTSYIRAGEYDVTLTVVDNDGATASSTQTVSVKAPVAVPNAAPVAAIAGGNRTVTVAGQLTLDGSPSADADGRVVSHAWDFGNGVTKLGETVAYAYPSTGTYTVTLTATDDDGATSTDTIVVTVNDVANTAPVASIAGGDRSGNTPFAFTVDASGSSDADGNIVAWDWDFGDTVTRSGETATHTYEFPGTYMVTLTVTDDRGAKATDTVTYTIRDAANIKPVASIAGGNLSGDAPFAFSMDGSGSSDEDGKVVAWDWNFGDGVTRSGENVMHTYTSAGTYTVTLTVTDDEGETATDTVVVSVKEAEPEPENTAPVAMIAGGDRTAKVPYAFTVDASGSTDSDGRIVSYEWDFGDTVTREGAVAEHTYEFVGVYTVTLTVTDQDGAKSTDTIKITVEEAEAANKAPVAVIGGGVRTGTTPYQFEIDGSGSTDSDGRIVSYEWDFGDTITATGAVANHGYAFPGTYTVTLTVTDEDGAKSQAQTVFQITDEETSDRDEKMMQIIVNMVRDDPDDMLNIVRRAKAVGSNIVYISDTKLNNWALGQNPGALWKSNFDKLYNGILAEGLPVVFNTVTLGYCNQILAGDRNLTTGYPVRNVELVRRGNQLVPVSSTSGLDNGSFENHSGNTVNNWYGYQDAPGELTFVDTNVSFDGNASLRMEPRNGTSTRISTSFDVKPFHQYTLRFWAKTQDLTGGAMELLITDSAVGGKRVASQTLSRPYPGGSGEREYLQPRGGLTMDWTEQRIAFNSREASKIDLLLATFGTSSGTMWWDKMELVETPTLNWLDRDGLDVTMTNQLGNRLVEGRDFVKIVDPGLGQSGYPGNYDTYHGAPTIQVPASSSITEGERVTLNGWHGQVVFYGQVGCAWNHPDTFAAIDKIHRNLEAEYDPHGYVLNYDEIRSGGYEPTDTAFATSGEALANSARTAIDLVIKNAGSDKPLYFWSDMFTPTHNAKADFQLVNNTLAGSWEGLDPKKVILATWWETYDIERLGRASLEFFANRGFEQIIGAYYDSNTAENHRLWKEASDGVPGITGDMFATWFEDYREIENYGRLWWQGDR